MNADKLQSTSAKGGEAGPQKPFEGWRWNLSIAAVFQNEARWLKEWLEYHCLTGVQHFYLYNNLSDDHYQDILRPYIVGGVVELIDWPYLSQSTYDESQCNAYRDAIRRTRNVVKWLALIDVDEFLVPIEEDSLYSVLSRFESKSIVGGVCVRWVCFGTSNIPNIPQDKLMIETLVLSADSDGPAFPWDQGTFKSIVRPERTLSVESPHVAVYIQGKSHTALGDNQMQINHYWTKDDSFFNDVKIPRNARRGVPAETSISWANKMNARSGMHLPIRRFANSLKSRMNADESRNKCSTERFLVIAPTAIGDSMVFSPLLKTLKVNAPDSVITLVACKSLEPLIRMFSAVDEIVILDDACYEAGKPFGPDADFAFARSYDTVVDTLCTAPFSKMLPGVFAKTKVGIDFSTDEPSAYTVEVQPFSAVENRSAIDCYLDYARALNMKSLVTSTALDTQRLTPVSSRAVEHLAGTLRSRPSIAFLLAGGDWHKRYPARMVTELIRLFSCAYQVLILFGPSEIEDYWGYLDEWKLAGNSRTHIFTGSLQHVIYLLSACSGALGNDCGLMHVSIGLGLPTLAVFGPSEPVAWFPYYHVSTQSFLVSQVQCRPCYGVEREICSYNLCMRQFRPPQIWEAFQQLQLSLP